jgi:outer membrane protein
LNWLIAAAAVLIQGQEPTLTLDEALRIAETNAFSLQIAQSNVERTRQRIAEARALQGPRLNGSVTYTRYDRESSQNGVVFSPIDQTIAALQLSMPIDITGVVARGIRATEVALRAAEEIVGSERNNLRQRVRRDYYAVLQAEAQVKVNEEALANARERYNVTAKEVEAGTKARIDLLRIDTQVRQAEADVIAAQNAVRLAKQNLNNTMSRPIETPFEPVDVPALPQVETPADTLVSRAQARRPDLLAQQFTVQQLELVRRAQEGGNYPTLNLAANHNQSLGSTGLGARRENTFGSLTVNVPIFDSGVTRARVKQARQDEEQAKVNLEQLLLAVSLEVRSALSNLTDAWQRYEVAQKGVEVAAETYRLAKIRYDAGEAILLEVVDAQTELTRAQTNLVQARYAYLTAFAALQRAVASDDPNSVREEEN